MKVLSMKVLSVKSIGALVALGLIAGMGSAVADTTTKPKLTIEEKAARKAAAELHKAAVVQFKSAIASYRSSADSARATFKAAYESAHSHQRLQLQRQQRIQRLQHLVPSQLRQRR
jgi:hypothetical protein